MTMQTFVVLIYRNIIWLEIGFIYSLLHLFEGIIGLPVFAGTPEKGLGIDLLCWSNWMGYLMVLFLLVFLQVCLIMIKIMLKTFLKLVICYFFYLYFWYVLVAQV